jgi:hypothetical protein
MVLRSGAAKSIPSFGSKGRDFQTLSLNKTKREHLSVAGAKHKDLTAEGAEGAKEEQ